MSNQLATQIPNVFDVNQLNLPTLKEKLLDLGDKFVLLNECFFEYVDEVQCSDNLGDLFDDGDSELDRLRIARYLKLHVQLCLSFDRKYRDTSFGYPNLQKWVHSGFSVQMCFENWMSIINELYVYTEHMADKSKYLLKRTRFDNHFTKGEMKECVKMMNQDRELFNEPDLCRGVIRELAKRLNYKNL